MKSNIGKRRVLKTNLLFHTNGKLYLTRFSKSTFHTNGTMFGDLD